VIPKAKQNLRQIQRKRNYKPGKPLYRFYQHRINPQLMFLVKLVQSEELDVLVNDDRGPCLVDTVATIFTRQSGLLCFKQDTVIN
jgi:hypothetical protein